MIPSPTPAYRPRGGFPAEPVRVGERPGVAGDGDPVRPGALRRDAGVLGQGTAPVERQLDVRRRGGELDVLAAEAPRHRQAALDVELLGRGDVRDAQQEHDVVDLPGGRAGVLLRRRRDLPDRPVGGAHHAAVAPEALLDGLDRRRARVEGGADQRVDRGRLRHHERQREPAEAGRRRLRRADAHLGAQAERGAVEAVGGVGVGHLEGDGRDGGGSRLDGGGGRAGHGRSSNRVEPNIRGS